MICAMCYRTPATIHEIVPKSRYPGGENDPDNTIPLCDACHREAHDNTVPDEVLYKALETYRRLTCQEK